MNGRINCTKITIAPHHHRSIILHDSKLKRMELARSRNGREQTGGICKKQNDNRVDRVDHQNARSTADPIGFQNEEEGAP